jgi:hypothetical protein
MHHKNDARSTQPAKDQQGSLATVAAASFLQQRLPHADGQSHWYWFLVNNRRGDRNPA